MAKTKKAKDTEDTDGDTPHTIRFPDDLLTWLFSSVEAEQKARPGFKVRLGDVVREKLYAQKALEERS